MRNIACMRKTIVLVLCLLSASAAVAATRRRIVSVAQATLTGRVVDLTTTAPVVQVEVEGSRLFARTDASGRFTLQLPAHQGVTLTFKRTGYETLTQTVMLTGNADRTFQLKPAPTARITTLSGTTHDVDADSVEFGWAIPFLGYRRDRSAKMCRPGGGEFMLDRNEIDRIEGPAITATDAACCANNPLTGAVFEMANGQRITAYFLESCNSAVMEVIARDHVTYELVFVPLRDLREVVMP